jgi:hypothetical protein
MIDSNVAYAIVERKEEEKKTGKEKKRKTISSRMCVCVLITIG